MTEPDPRPLYERDPDAYRAHLAEGNAKQARKRVGVDALILDHDGRILLVDPTYKPNWDLPGGMAETNEPPLDALRRELAEELGLHLPEGMALVCGLGRTSRPVGRLPDADLQHRCPHPRPNHRAPHRR
jgi:8-oxo-dGTP pyrophosphatase MutT (NUDIX family)